MTFLKRQALCTGMLTAAVLLGACTSSPHGGAHVARPRSSATMTRSFSLSPALRTDPTTGITLIRVRPDGAATIRPSATSGMQTVLPGGYYGGKELGRHGLQLLSSSPASGTATFQRTSAE